MENNISTNSKMNVVEEISKLLKLEQDREGIKPSHPKKLVVNGRPTKKALAYNRKLIKEGKTFGYLDPDKFIRITKDGKIREVNKKYDKRYKDKRLLKSQKELDTYGSIISQGNLTNVDKLNYVNRIKREFNNKKNTPGSTIKVDLKKMSFKTFIKIMTQFANNNRGYLASIEGTGTWRPLHSSNLTKLKNYQDLLGSEFVEREGSDTQFIFQLDKNPVLLIKTTEFLGQKPQGSFFKYYHDLEIDLSRYDIHQFKPENYIHNCLYVALKEGGLEQSKLNDLREYVKCGSVPSCRLTKICNKIGITIHLRKPNAVRLLKFGNTGKIYLLGLIDNHYFLIDKTDVTGYAIDHYDEVKSEPNWNYIYKKRDGIYRRDPKRCLDSYKVINHLLKNKDTRLTPIPVEEIMESPYHNNVNLDNVDLEYSPECLKENKPTSKDNSGIPIMYFDFETDTSGLKHIPYLVCADFGGQKTTCYGYECGKELLRWIKDICKRDEIKKIMFVAHNLRYDYTFIMDWLYSLKPIMKGNRIMGGTARMYYGDKKFTEVNFLDSCNLITTKLGNFGGMFDLDQGKEVLPYALYTQGNIDRKYIDLKLINEYLKKEDRSDFLENAKKWNCYDQKRNEVDIVEYSERYCKIDVEVLKKGFNQFRIWIKQITGLDAINYCSIASLGLDYIIKEGCFEGCLQMSGRPREFIQRCVVGGRCMTRDNKKWYTKKRVADFDAVSLYPSAMARMRGFLKGRPKVIKNKSFDWLILNTDGFFVRVKCTNNPTKNRGFPLLSNTDPKTGIRNFSNDTKNNEYYIDRTTYEDCIKYQGLKFELISGYYYDEGFNDKINSVIKHLFQARLDAKAVGNPIQAIYKLLMNSCYGKCLLKPIDSEVEIITHNNWDKFLSYNYNYIRQFTEMKNCYVVHKIKPINEHFNNVYAGVEILSMSKRIMNEVMCLAEDMNANIYYQDTDSMHIDENQIDPLAKKYKLFYNRELIGKNMGQFHSDFDMKGCEDVVAYESIFLGKKAYADKLVGIDKKTQKRKYDVHVRMKGINREGIDHYCEKYNVDLFDVYKHLYEHNSLPEGRKFDLLAGGKACKFEYNEDMSISSVGEFARSVCFNYQKGIICT